MSQNQNANLWIRSQGGGLYLVTNVYYTNLYSECNERKIKTIIEGSEFVLGRYNSNEECIEIIDEITELLRDAQIDKRLIYKMPNDWDMSDKRIKRRRA